MIDETPIANKTIPSGATSHNRRGFPFDESAGSQNRPGVSRFSSGTNHETPRQEIRRSSSNFSDYSFKDARNAFQSSTEELLLPRPNTTENRESSPWHSAPLAFALLPALAGILFTNGSSIATDIMLLGLAAVFLNWSVRIPWEWYHAAQATRQIYEDKYDAEVLMERDNYSAVLHDVPEEDEILKEKSQDLLSDKQFPKQREATSELYKLENIALLSCFAFPLLGAYLLHSLRSQLNRPSDGLVSNYNLTIFLLASELRPMAHVVKLIQARTLHLKKIIVPNSHYDSIASKVTKDISQRLEDLEARFNVNEKASVIELGDKKSGEVITEVRKSMQTDLDALNRAVRRYEKRATLQATQTESRLQEIESRLNDAVSLAAAAANRNCRHGGSSTAVFEWGIATIILPLRILGIIFALPLTLISASFEVTRYWISGNPKRTEKPNKSPSGKFSPASRSRNWPFSQSRISRRAYG